MRIQTRFILSVAGVLTASLLAAGWSWQHVQEGQLEADANRQAQAVMSLLQASRDYPGDLARGAGIQAIAKAFTKIQSGYQIHEASDNPLNPADRPDSVESTLLQRLRASAHPDPITLFIRDDHGQEWYIAGRPIVAQSSCLECHGSAEHASQEMIATYGSTHGFGWKDGQVVGVQTVRLNLAELRAAQAQVSSRLLVWVCQLGLAALIGVYVSVRWIVTKPLTRVGLQMQEIAEHRTYTHPLEEANRKDELGVCATAFNHLLGVVRQTVHDLSDSNANLEQRVADRTAELAKQTQRVEAANRAKSDFLANMSHEIRTPLNGAIGAMQLLESSSLDDKQKRFASTAKACAHALLSLINDVLDFSKIEAGKLELVREAFDLRQVVDETLAIFSQRAAEKDLFLTCQLPGDTACGWWGDPSRIRQILVNLIGNAIKFTSTGGIELRIEQLEQLDDFATLKFSVRDSGIGIPADRLDRLFKSFSQVDASTTRQYGGTGLGLAISRQLAELMGGTVGLESKTGVGSTFWFTARLQEAPASALPTAELPQPDNASTANQRGHILVVDDNDVNQMILAEMLKQAGHDVKIAGNGKEALELYQQESFDLIVSDCHMPVMDGYEFARSVREKESEQQNGRRIPIIALTASALRGDGDRCIEAGMDDYATKPIDQVRLLSLIRRWMRPAESPIEALIDDAEPITEEAAASEPTVEPIAEPTPPAPDAKPIKMDSLLELCMGDEKFVRTMLDKFQATLGDSLAAIEQAISSADADATSKSAHKLKGSASYFSAEPIRYFAAEIETLSKNGSLAGAEELLSQLRPQVQRCLDFIHEFLTPAQPEAELEALEFADG
jgi:signal transduction histidine kinase/CheY-like chemotaxis protein/HPt (histidine-containing phosphotransfer) domain-containing protein